ncbi:hypothetical protein [Streptomyces sp. GESEQ-35]|uniref:hypothetical protein n=1 Tax=Streptomyces sp. GESEQ-35 TaxID=2812657 RepID=UPI001B329F81|nr:hypothetical protein [Streptomyces sp. GESEQ-35]
MSASENSAESAQHKVRPQQSYAVGGVSMQDLLASCAAANAISTPPRAPEPYETEGRRAA